MGTMWDFAQDERLGALAAAVYERGGVVAAVCHGPAALLSAKLASGSQISAARRGACRPDLVSGTGRALRAEELT